MTSKELTYQDIIKLRKEIEKKGNTNEHPIVITYWQAMQIESECLALEQENEKLKNENQILNQSVKDTYDTSQEIINEIKQVYQKYIEEKEKKGNICFANIKW